MKTSSGQRDKQQVDFGRWLKDLRQRSGFPSQKEFAGMLRITDVQLSRIEGGTSGISAETLNTAIELLRCDALEAYKRAGLLPKLKIDKVEDALDVISFFDQKGIRDEDREAIRPLLESADRMIDLLRAKHARVVTGPEWEKEEDPTPDIFGKG